MSMNNGILDFWYLVIRKFYIRAFTRHSVTANRQKKKCDVTKV